MLRLLVLALALANMSYFAWTQGTLAPYGFAPAVQSEPQRLIQQLRPDALRILTPLEVEQLKNQADSTAVPNAPAAIEAQTEPASAPASASAPAASAAPAVSTAATVPTAPSSASVAATTTAALSQTSVVAPVQCLQAGLFSDEQAAALQTRLQAALPAGSWAFEASSAPARWIIYMGKYATAEALIKKRGELRQINVSFEPLNNPALEPGLSLGSFGSEPDADAELARIAKRGVKTAKVMQVQPELRGQKLKLASVTPSLRAQLDTLKPQLLGNALKVCQ